MHVNTFQKLFSGSDWLVREQPTRIELNCVRNSFAFMENDRILFVMLSETIFLLDHFATLLWRKLMTATKNCF